MKEYRVWYSSSSHDSWIKGGFTEPTTDKKKALDKYYYWLNAGHEVKLYERDISPWSDISALS